MKSMKYLALLLLPALAFAAGAVMSKESCNWTLVEVLILLTIADYVWLSGSGVPPAITLVSRP
jgi:hypothetical protein